MHCYFTSCRNLCRNLCRNFFVESKSFLSLQTGKKYTIHSRLSCDSKNVIYLVSCKKCRLQYIGSTTTDFRIRFRNHKSAMLTNKTTCEVAVHFNKTSHILDVSLLFKAPPGILLSIGPLGLQRPRFGILV